MKKRNIDMITRYLLHENFCDTEEERRQLQSALIGAMLWSEKVDKYDQKVKIKLYEKGVTFKAGES